MPAKHAAPRPHHRRTVLVPLAAAAALVAAAVVGGTAQAATQTKYYTASATPQYVDAGSQPTTETFTLTNCGPSPCTRASTQALGSANVTLPSAWGFASTSTPPLVQVYSGGALNATKTPHWSISTWGTDSAGNLVAQLRNDGTSSAYALAPGDYLSFGAAFVPDHSGVVNVTTATKQSNDFSGTGNNFTLVGGDPVIYVGKPDHLEFGVGPSDVQVSTSTSTHAMCPPPTVKIVDKLGNPVTWVAQTDITLLPAADAQARSSGLKYNGSASLTQKTAAGTGVATFGTGSTTSCTGLTATGLGGVYPLGATATWSGTTLTVPAADVPGFSVLQFVGTCGATSTDCATPQLFDPSGHTSAQVTGAPNPSAPTPNPMSVGLGIDTYDALSCNDHNPYRLPTQIYVANHSKSVTLVWDKKAVQWETNNGTPFWDVCFSAPYAFPTRSIYTAEPPASGGIWEGDLVDCGTVDTPAFPAGTYPCVVNRGKQAASEVVQVSIPLNGAADPKMV